ncbi:hypothetical protein MLD38_028584 [Melastoma candidum]|uniref:Uncharacterized protein n=1 Tax=Melastoma candidum TaxID=119954 RepID=A0ACB9N1E0_9MYRT|nr:hypothetical protein MLD38_028584 [Melastoma candidum]
MSGSDAMEDSSPIPPPTPPSFSHSRHPNFSNRHFYLAVDRHQFKMDTLIDLLRVAGRRAGLPLVVCCSSRDELDAVCCSVSNLPFITLEALYSDLAEVERARVLERFRQSTIRWSQNPEIGFTADGNNNEDVEQKSHVVVVTDTCVPLIGSGESSMSARLIINYELPTKKEIYARRIAACLAADGIVINMVVGGEVVTLKSLEESSNLLISEMPINISEIL